MKPKFQFAIPNQFLAHLVGFWHICMLIRGKYQEDTFKERVHVIPGLIYIAMNCKDHSFTRLLFFLTQFGFVAVCYSYTAYVMFKPYQKE